MEFKTKYKKGDFVYFMHNEIPVKEEIIGTTHFFGCKVFSDGRRIDSGESPSIVYHTASGKDVHELDACPSKEELIKLVFEQLD
jgi:hypothetical protein